MSSTKFYSNGKLLLTGEYVVLDGALSLALPTKYGQSLEALSNKSDFISWKSLDENDDIWFETILKLDELEIGSAETSQNDIHERLIQILKAAKQLNPNFLNSGFSVETKLNFPRDWGLGTSSTLINNMASWTQVNPYKLLELTFGGSGYDIACAQHNTPITYQLLKPFNCAQGDQRVVNAVNFNPSFKDCLYFVYLNKKQNSRDAIQTYRQNTSDLSQGIRSINEITKKIITCQSLLEFETLITKHEHIISNIIKQKPIKERLFSDFTGSIKSLGAWGGDFVLVTSKENPSAYFKAKGFEIIIPYQNITLFLEHN